MIATASIYRPFHSVAPAAGIPAPGGLLLAVALLLGMLARRFGMPAIAGELCAGVIAGLSVLSHIAPGLSGWLFPPSGSQPPHGAKKRLRADVDASLLSTAEIDDLPITDKACHREEQPGHRLSR